MSGQLEVVSAERERTRSWLCIRDQLTAGCSVSESAVQALARLAPANPELVLSLHRLRRGRIESQQGDFWRPLPTYRISQSSTASRQKTGLQARVKLMMHMRALKERTHHLRDASIDQMSRLSIPRVRPLVVLLAAVVPTVIGAFWLRVAVLEDRAVGLACRQGSEDWLCLVRNAATFSYEHALLGSFAVLIASVNLVRPSYVTFAVATCAATIGAIVYNVGGAAIAITLLILSLARRERETI
jgi:hypothetical protein